MRAGVAVVGPGVGPGGGPDGAGVVVSAGPVSGRAAAAGTAVTRGADVFVAWPPGAVAEAEALRRRADEAGVEVGVERPVAADLVRRAASGGPDAPPRLVAITLDATSASWPRHLAGALDVAARLVGSREATRLDAEAERDGPALRAVAVAVRFRNGAFAQVLVRAAPAQGLTVYAAGIETSVPAAGTLGDEAVAFVQAMAARQPAPFSLDDALATMRLAERVMAALR